MNTFLTVVGTAVSIVGLLLGIFAIWQRRRKSWRQVLREVRRLNAVLSGKFDFIISFADGGLIAADLLHIKYHPDKPIVSLHLEIKRPDKGPKVVNILTDNESLDFLRNAKILLIDDVVQTGRNMEAAVNYLTSEVGIERAKIVTAVLGKPKGITGFVVDYYGFVYSGTIELPWGPVPRHS